MSNGAEVSLPPALAKSVQRFEGITEPKKRYEYLLWFAKRLPPFPEADKQPDNKVIGCVSQVYITATVNDGVMVFQGDSDAHITKGLVGFLITGLNGLPPAQITQLTPDFIARTGLNVSLTPSRANGFYNIFTKMQQLALAVAISADQSPTGLPPAEELR